MELLFKAIVGSQSYGTNIETSDIDYKGVYISSLEDLFKIDVDDYLAINKDESYFEVSKFLKLLSKANPTAIELLFTPDDCIVYKHPLFEEIIRNRDLFITKECAKTFYKYAESEITKAIGTDKMMNWEKSEMVRKTPLDFIYFINNDGSSIPLINYLEKNGLRQDNCGIAHANNTNGIYALYHDDTSNRECRFKGIILDDSTDVRLSSIPKNKKPLGLISFNKNGYSQHCKKYNQYTKWLSERNEQRYVDVEGHNQKIDGKNMLHCVRLVDISKEIALTGKFNVRRPNAEYLKEIRKGKYNLETIVKNVQVELVDIDGLYKESNLPEICDIDVVNKILYNIRMSYIKSKI